jgi:superfamily II DNA or RNA helicase
MIKLYPTKIVITNYQPGEKEDMERFLSVWDKVIFDYSFSAFLLDEDKEEIVIPGGYDLNELRRFFPREEYEDHRDNLDPYRKVKFSLKFPPRNQNQKNAIDFLVKTKSAQKFLCLPTGAGKTYCSIHYTLRSGKLPMTLVDTENLAEQWKKSILFFTNIKEEEIFMIKGKDSINKLLKMKKDELKKFKWFIASHRTIGAFMGDDMEKLDGLFKHLEIGVKLYDEAHVEMKNIFYMDSVTNTESVYITATPNRSNPQDQKVYKRMFADVPMFRLKEGDVERYHNVMVVKYNSKPSLKEQTGMKNKHGFDVNKWCRYILEEDNYATLSSILIQLIGKFNKNRDKKMLLLFPTMEGNGILHEDLSAEFPDIQVGRFDSSIKDKNKRVLELDKDLIISTDKSFGKAIDVKGLSVVFNTIPFGSQTMAEQMMGRLREIPGEEVWFIDLNDVGFDNVKNQMKLKRTVFNKKAKEIFELDLTGGAAK